MVSPAEAVEMQRSGSSLHRTDESGFWHGSKAPRDGSGHGSKAPRDGYLFYKNTASADACVPLSPKVEFQHIVYFTTLYLKA